MSSLAKLDFAKVICFWLHDQWCLADSFIKLLLYMMLKVDGKVSDVELKAPLAFLSNLVALGELDRTLRDAS